MKRFLSERNLVVFLFVIASACFVLAEQDAKRVEKLLMAPADDVSSILPRPNQTAGNNSPEKAPEFKAEYIPYR